MAELFADSPPSLKLHAVPSGTNIRTVAKKHLGTKAARVRQAAQHLDASHLGLEAA